MNEKELLEFCGLKIGQKVLYLHSYTSSSSVPEIVTIKGTALNYNDEIIVFVNEYDGYLNLSDIYTETQIYKMFNPDQLSKYKGIWKPSHKLAELAVESEWEAIHLINLLIDKFGVVRTMDLIRDAIEKKKEEKKRIFEEELDE